MSRREQAPWRQMRLAARPEPIPCQLGTAAGGADGNTLTKVVFMVLLTLQAVVTTALFRLSQSRIKNPEDGYFIGASVSMIQLFKIVCCILVLWLKQWPTTLGSVVADTWETSVKDIETTVILGFIALARVFHNYLLFVAAKYVDTTVFLVTTQLKTLTAAFFAVVMAKKHLNPKHWVWLVTLVLGVGWLQYNMSKEESKEEAGNTFLGATALLGVATLSGYIGTALELLLKKKPDVSAWMRTLQISLFGLVMAVIGTYADSGEQIQKKGFLHGFNTLVWACVAAQGAGGMIVSVVLKYADNIIKSFATAMAIVLSALFDAFFMGVEFPFQAIVGVATVIISILGYTHEEMNPSSSNFA